MVEFVVVGMVGIILGFYWMSGWLLLDMVKNVLSVVWKLIEILVGFEGKVMCYGIQFVNGVILIKKDMEYLEVFFIYENYLFDNYVDFVLGSLYDNGLFEKYDY